MRARWAPKMYRSTLRTKGSVESPEPFMPWIAVTPPAIARISAYRSRAPGTVSSVFISRFGALTKRSYNGLSRHL